MRKTSKGQDVYVNWGTILNEDDEGKTGVLTRIGKGKAQTQNWKLSTDEEAAFYPGNVAAFIRSLLEVDSLVLQVTPYSAKPITAVFNVGGVRSSIEKNAPEMLDTAPEFERPAIKKHRKRQQTRVESHRAGLILALGLIGLCVPIVGFVAWCMGHSDLQKMDKGAMDESGRATTKTGMVLGIIDTVFIVIAIFLAGIG